MISEEIAQQTISLAAKLLADAQAQQTREEQRQAAKIAAMMDDPHGKLLTTILPDQAFRSHNPARVADQISYLLKRYGVPRYFDQWEQIALHLAEWAGTVLPQVVVPLLVARLRQETQSVILRGEEEHLSAYLQERRKDGIRLNLNQLGEAILGEEEAARRLDAYLRLLARPDVEYISVKISSIFSQINLIAFDHTVEEIKSRLRKLYRAAMQHHYTAPDGAAHPKFVNLDMEEYRDLRLTLAAFQGVLDEEEFMTHRAGIVLQAYLPDSAQAQRDLTAWAIQRVQKGGAPIKLRLVKGANLAMEKVEAAWQGWEQAPYHTKEEVDANFKRMVTYACQPDHARAVHVGIASHNLFDVAYGLILREKFNLGELVEFEMLEGMANHQARAVQKAAGGLLLYAPVVKKEDFHSAIAYLMRRLDENTADENFLHDLFGLEVGSAAWEAQKGRFLQSFRRMNEVSDQPQRTQNRQTEQITFSPDDPFRSVPDTDWALPRNQAWINAIHDTWERREIAPIPLQIGGEWVTGERHGGGCDPSRPNRPAYTYALADREHIDRALSIAQAAQTTWGGLSIRQRKEKLVRCAEVLAGGRGDLIGAMILDSGKRAFEADIEVSKAVDLANYYARSLDLADSELADCDFAPLGTLLVAPSWSFPLAVACGGVLAALMAGNTVILKPAPEAVLVAWQMVNLLWEAGIPKDALQFLPTDEDEVGKSLVTDERLNGVILTGDYRTARLFKSWKPDLNLFADTSGKNALFVSAMADHDQAIKDLVKSAFGYNGQECSAASLAILEAEIYDDPAFLRQLRDAAASLAVGSAWEMHSIITPLIRPPNDELRRGLTQLDEGESWLLEPRQLSDHLWSPGIKLGVQPGSFYHKTECLGPILGLMRAKNLDHAIEIVNESEFGLASGIHSLDPREIETWQARIEVGNAYINRALALRLPFGGWKHSAFGCAKVGGPNYVLSLGTWREKQPQPQTEEEILRSYQAAWDRYFSQASDLNRVLGASNIFRYRPLEHVILRITDASQLPEAKKVLLAARVCGVRLTVSAAPNMANLEGYHAILEDEPQFIQRLHREKPSRLRLLAPPSRAVREAAIELHVPLVDAPPLSTGRLELRHYLNEQVVSRTMHRYGNVIEE